MQLWPMGRWNILCRRDDAAGGRADDLRGAVCDLPAAVGRRRPVCDDGDSLREESGSSIRRRFARGLAHIRVGSDPNISLRCSSTCLAAGIRSRGNSSGVRPTLRIGCRRRRYARLPPHERVLAGMFFPVGGVDPRVWWAWAAIVGSAASGVEMLQLQLWDQSWAWQFRPPAPCGCCGRRGWRNSKVILM